MRKLIAAILILAGLGYAWAQIAPVPALPDAERRTEYNISAQTGPLNVGFALYGDSTDYTNWIGVYVNGIATTAYTLSSPSGVVGSIALPITDAQITFTVAQTGKVEIIGARRPRRTSQLAENRGVSAHDFNLIITDLTAQIREMWDRASNRVVQAPPGETMTILPPAATRANQNAIFDGSGNLTPGLPASGTFPISASMAPVVNAGSLAAGRTAFGLGTAAVENVGSYGLADDGAGALRQNMTVTADGINQSVTASFYFGRRVCTGPITYTLARANTLFTGFGFTVTAISGNCTVTPNAADKFRGTAATSSIVIPQGTTCYISTDAAASGTWQSDCHNQQQNLSASIAFSALTITLNGTVLPFRDSTLANGDVLYAIPAGGLSITIPSTATLGVTNGSINTPFRIWVFAAYNSGTPVLGVATCSGTTGTIYGCAAWETLQKSGTAITAGSTALGTLYTASAVTNDSVRIIGYVEYANGLVTPGTWATSPTTAQLCIAPFVCKRPGDVIQTVPASSTAAATTTSATFAALSSGLTNSIIPLSGANILRIFMQGSIAESTNQNMFLQMTRGTTQIGNPVKSTSGNTSVSTMPVSWVTYDAPGVTSSTTYQAYGKTDAGTLSFPPAGTGVFIEIQEIMGALPEPANDNGDRALRMVG